MTRSCSRQAKAAFPVTSIFVENSSKNTCWHGCQLSWFPAWKRLQKHHNTEQMVFSVDNLSCSIWTCVPILNCVAECRGESAHRIQSQTCRALDKALDVMMKNNMHVPENDMRCATTKVFLWPAMSGHCSGISSTDSTVPCPLTRYKHCS
jgi:hypothetical protein